MPVWRSGAFDSFCAYWRSRCVRVQPVWVKRNSSKFRRGMSGSLPWPANANLPCRDDMRPLRSVKQQPLLCVASASFFVDHGLSTCEHSRYGAIAGAFDIRQCEAMKLCPLCGKSKADSSAKNIAQKKRAMTREIPVRPMIAIGRNHRAIGWKAQKQGGLMGPESAFEKQSSFNALTREAGGARCWKITERNPSVISTSP